MLVLAFFLTACGGGWLPGSFGDTNDQVDAGSSSGDLGGMFDSSTVPVELDQKCPDGLEKVVITESYPLSWEWSSGHDFVIRAIGYGHSEFYSSNTAPLVPRRGYNSYCFHQEKPFVLAPGDTACLDSNNERDSGFNGYNECYNWFELSQLMPSTRDKVIRCEFAMEHGDTPPQTTVNVQGVTLSYHDNYVWYDNTLWEMVVNPSKLSEFSLLKQTNDTDSYSLVFSLPEYLFYLASLDEETYPDAMVQLTVFYAPTSDEETLRSLSTNSCRLMLE